MSTVPRECEPSDPFTFRASLPWLTEVLKGSDVDAEGHWG